jgi:hypothetical protein
LHGSLGSGFARREDARPGMTGQKVTDHSHPK